MVVPSQREQTFNGAQAWESMWIYFFSEALHKEKRFWNVLILQVRPFHSNVNGVFVPKHGHFKKGTL